MALLLLTAGPPDRLTAQLAAHAQAIPLITRAWHTPGDETLTEFAVTQPVVMAEWRGPHLFVRATLDAEGLTIPDGELTPGAHGEGYYDRRHPHTYVHELIAGVGVCPVSALGCGLSAGVVAGKGFVAFGTDDPMSRPTVRYPVNHHLGQILERAVVIGSVRYRGVSIERSWFNGDEPTRPRDWPNWDRGLDSRAWRLSAAPWDGAEAQYSYAEVKSPEHRPGAGPTQKKKDLSARVERAVRGRPVYALLEWARTEEASGFFVYESRLAEVAATFGAHRPYARFEQTERPEEERTLDPFRSRRPHLDNSIIGRTRWRILTLGYGVSRLTARGRLEWRPFVEGSLARVERIDGIFDPEAFYGSDVLPSLSAGVRLDWGGMSRMRMGRYLTPSDHSDHMDHH